MPTYDHAGSSDANANIYYDFITKLWGTGGEAVREELFNQPSPMALHSVLRDKHKIDIPDFVHIILVDIEGARTKNFPVSIKTTDTYYCFVMPPKPIKSQDDKYVDRQKWSEASFHASNDGYGM